MIFPTLYKKDSKGKVREWRMELDGNKYRTIAGLQDGEQVTSSWTTVATGKNIGRANETSAEEQAKSEVESKYTKKRKTAYHDTIDTIDTAKIFDPMAAYPWAKRKDKIKWGEVRAFSQPKLDGIRCIVDRFGMWSRKGEKIVAVPHIFEELQPYFKLNPSLRLDGELYNHELKADFNQIVSICKKQTPTADQLATAKRMVQYHVYDMPSDHLLDLPYSDRLDALVKLTSDLTTDTIVLTPTIEIESEAQFDALYENYLDAGYEGGMVRLNAKYHNKRCNDLIKRKDFDDEEFTIVAIVEGKGNWSGVAKRVTFQNNQGACGEFGAGLMGSKSYALHVWENRESYIGKQGTVQFMGRSKDDCVPRHTTAKILHEDERW
jgi:DNA ligase-1